MESETILVIGACGQVGTELTHLLRTHYSPKNVIAGDLKNPTEEIRENGPFEHLDVLDQNQLFTLVRKYGVTQIYNLAAMLSATAEKKPMQGWKLNIEGLLNVLNLAKEEKLKRIFWPSSIAVFGPGTPKENTPQNTLMDPNTVYGISKLAGERWCDYYFHNYGVDVRSLRYPGLISHKTEPGGGTTDYAVDIFHHALKTKSYECFLAKDTNLPMLYMPDAIKGTVDLMQAPADRINVRSSYNIAGFSFSPEELSEEIRKHIPQFQISYSPDFRQEIAEGWPASVDDRKARENWGWHPDYDLSQMVKDMLEHIDSPVET